MLIQSWHEEYTPLLDYYHQLIQKLASNQNQELIHLQQRKTLGLKRSNETLTLNPVLSPEDNPIKLLAVKVQTKLDDLLENEEPKHYIIEENKQITEQIKQSNFKFSEKTRQRITKEINEILTHSETEGIGPYQVAEQIRDKFAELKGYEANRIARTEINRADNTYRYDDIMNNKLIDYIQWHGHDDGKERDSHIKCNGEIIRKGELFSNGLRYPGDPQAPAKEVINCRCTIVPYIPPFDKMVPTGMDSFKEGDLIDKPENAGTQFLLETIENTRIITPAEGGLNVNLDNIRISNVKETLGKLSQQTLDGYLKTKKEVQSTLDKLLGINKKTKPTGINKFKKKLHDNWKQYKPTTLDDIQPFNSKAPTPVIKPKPVTYDNIEDKSIKELKEIKKNLEHALEQKAKQKASYTLTQEEQETLDQLTEKLLENGGSLDLKKGKVIINNKGLNTTEVNKLKKLHEKRLNILKQKPIENKIQPSYNLNKSPEPVDIDKFEKKLEDNWKNVEPTSFDKQQTMYDIKTPQPSSLTSEEQETYHNLLEKLTSNGGKIERHKNKISIEGKGLTFHEKNTLKKLHAKQNNIKQNKVTKEERRKLIEEQELQKEKIQKRINEIQEDINKSKKLQKNIRKQAFNVKDSISTVQEKIDRKILLLEQKRDEEIRKYLPRLEDLPKEVQKEVNDLRLAYFKAEEENKFFESLEDLTDEQFEKYDKNQKLLEEDIDLKIRLITKKYSNTKKVQEIREKYRTKINNLKEHKLRTQCNRLKRYTKLLDREYRIAKRRVPLEEEKVKLQREQGKNLTDIIPPKSRERINGEVFNGFDGIKDSPDYDEFSTQLHAQLGTRNDTKIFYTDGSGAFNKYIARKTQGASQEELDEIVKYEFEHCAPEKFDGKYKGIESPEQLKELFEKREKELIEQARELEEGMIVYSGRNYERFSGLAEGEDVNYFGITSVSFDKEIATKFAKRVADKGQTPVIQKVYIRKGTKCNTILDSAIEKNRNESEITLKNEETGTLLLEETRTDPETGLDYIYQEIII